MAAQPRALGMLAPRHGGEVVGVAPSPDDAPRRSEQPPVGYRSVSVRGRGQRERERVGPMEIQIQTLASM